MTDEDVAIRAKLVAEWVEAIDGEEMALEVFDVKLHELSRAARTVEAWATAPLPDRLATAREKGIEWMIEGVDKANVAIFKAYTPEAMREDGTRVIRLVRALGVIEEAEDELIGSTVASPSDLFFSPWITAWKMLVQIWTNRRVVWKLLKLMGGAMSNERTGLFSVLAVVVSVLAVTLTASDFAVAAARALKSKLYYERRMRSLALPQFPQRRSRRVARSRGGARANVGTQDDDSA